MSGNREYGVIKRMRQRLNERQPTVLKTVYNGKLIVYNVPFTQRKDGELGVDGESEYLTGNVMYNMAGIFEYMIENDLNEYKYVNYKRGDINE
ncbi:hypothetical protein WKH56_20510 [Priestia sp. SB1]|uniref:hypothetical protein n=1 Tax=Priestia sp. SB1 TaxID=3132359 RepID=UPI0031797E7B